MDSENEQICPRKVFKNYVGNEEIKKLIVTVVTPKLGAKHERSTRSYVVISEHRVFL